MWPEQIYSMAYGTLPIVREVGGLKDTVIDVDVEPENATGFSFHYPLGKRSADHYAACAYFLSAATGEDAANSAKGNEAEF